jgi:hypothetical protein
MLLKFIQKHANLQKACSPTRFSSSSAIVWILISPSMFLMGFYILFGIPCEHEIYDSISPRFWSIIYQWDIGLIWRQPLVRQYFLFWVYASNVCKMCFIWCRPCFYVSQISFPCIAGDPQYGRRACSALKMERVDQYVWPSSMIMIPAWWRCSGTNLRSCVRVVCDDVVAFFCKWPSIDPRGAVSLSTAIASNFANLPRKHLVVCTM